MTLEEEVATVKKNNEKRLELIAEDLNELKETGSDQKEKKGREGKKKNKNKKRKRGMSDNLFEGEMADKKRPKTQDA